MAWISERNPVAFSEALFVDPPCLASGGHHALNEKPAGIPWEIRWGVFAKPAWKDRREETDGSARPTPPPGFK